MKKFVTLNLFLALFSLSAFAGEESTPSSADHCAEERVADGKTAESSKEVEQAEGAKTDGV